MPHEQNFDQANNSVLLGTLYAVLILLTKRSYALQVIMASCAKKFTVYLNSLSMIVEKDEIYGYMGNHP